MTESSALGQRKFLPPRDRCKGHPYGRTSLPITPCLEAQDYRRHEPDPGASARHPQTPLGPHSDPEGKQMPHPNIVRCPRSLLTGTVTSDQVPGVDMCLGAGGSRFACTHPPMVRDPRRLTHPAVPSADRVSHATGCAAVDASRDAAMPPAFLKRRSSGLLVCRLRARRQRPILSASSLTGTATTALLARVVHGVWRNVRRAPSVRILVFVADISCRCESNAP